MVCTISAKQAVAVLEGQLAWVKGQRAATGEGGNRVQSIVRQCVGLLEQSTTDYHGWVRRRDRVQHRLRVDVSIQPVSRTVDELAV